MTHSGDLAPLTVEQLDRILARYGADELVVSTAYADAGVDPLQGRLWRAAVNQMEQGDATGSRYAIWANTVRDNIIVALKPFEEGDAMAGRRHLVRAANSLSAYTDVQAYFDPFELGKLG